WPLCGNTRCGGSSMRVCRSCSIPMILACSAARWPASTSWLGRGSGFRMRNWRSSRRTVFAMRFGMRGKPIVVLLSSFFTALGLLFIPYLGVQQDEGLFALAIFVPPQWTTSRIRIAHAEVPLMLMSYLGALKSWIYAGLLHWSKPSVWLLRTPALLIA